MEAVLLNKAILWTAKPKTVGLQRVDEAPHEAQLLVLGQLTRDRKWRLRGNSLKGALLPAKTSAPLPIREGSAAFSSHYYKPILYVDETLYDKMSPPLSLLSGFYEELFAVRNANPYGENH